MEKISTTVGKYIVEIDMMYVEMLCKKFDKDPQTILNELMKDFHDFLFGHESSLILCNVFLDNYGHVRKAFHVKRIEGKRIGKRLKRLKRKK